MPSRGASKRLGLALFGRLWRRLIPTFVGPRRGIEEVTVKNLGLTFGFAWNLGAKHGWLKRIVGDEGKTVFRGGYAIAYNRQPMEDFDTVFRTNPGSFLTATRSLTLGNLINPGLQGGASFTGNGGYSRYDAMQVELRRRLSRGLLVQGSYVFAKGFSSSRVSLRAPRVNALGGTLRHAFKANWVYELPFGHGKPLFGNASGVFERLLGGWEFHGTTRIQSGQVFNFGATTNFGDVRLIGMTARDLQKAFKLRFDDANKVIYNLPQDIIDNTIRAFSTSATSPTGYGSLGPPTGRHIAPGNSASCIQVVSGDCAPQDIYVYGPMFTRFDLGVVKKIKIKERANFELRGEFLNAFNHINFFGNIGGNNGNFNSANFSQRIENRGSPCL